MKPPSCLPAVAGVIVSTLLALGACQTTPNPTSPPAASPTQAMKPAQTPKPIATDAARNLAGNCLACHGLGGRRPGTIPSLDRLSADEIATQLKNFKSGSRASTVMGRLARGYSDAEIDAIAKFIIENR